MVNLNWTHIRARIKVAALALPQFAKNPVQGMRNLPDWEWPEMLALQGAFAASCAALANLVERNFLGVITGLIIAPLANYMVIAIGAGFFYYVFLFFFQREIPYLKIYQHVLFASLPIMLVVIVGSLLPPLFLVAGAAALTLMYVGFVSNFQLERKKLSRLLMTLMGIYLFWWAIQMVNFSTQKESHRMKATPESLDILEKELDF
ncbi:MAG: YIP1 family protein [Bdellovibrionales bacterium]